jgi:hypothetical protein
MFDYKARFSVQLSATPDPAQEGENGDDDGGGS